MRSITRAKAPTPAGVFIANFSRRAIRIGRHRLVQIKRKYEITARPLRRFRVTADSDHDLPVAQNILDRHFHADTPNTKWACDVTYVWSKQGWLYLAVVLDLFSRRVVGWSMSENMERSLVLDALAMALATRKPAAGLLCHSDQGSQYASRGLSGGFESSRGRVQHEPQGQLLGQCSDGEFLCLCEARAGLQNHLRNAGRSPGGPLRVDRRLVQPQAHALCGVLCQS